MKVLAIDGDNVFRRNWEAAEGQELGTAHDRTLSSFRNNQDTFDRIIFAWDGGEGGGVGGFRRARVPEYKANRNDPGPVYREQRARTIDDLRQHGAICIIGPEVDIDGSVGVAESDDILGWVTREHSAMAGDECYLQIVSGDGDIECLACESPIVEIIKPGMRRDEAVWNAAKVEERRGVKPDQIAHVKALMGDKSDNYAGFEGIGEKTAAFLVRRYGSCIDAVTMAPDDKEVAAKDLDKTARASLKSGGVQHAAKGLWLATLRPELPLNYEELVINHKMPESPPPKEAPFKRQTQTDESKPASSPPTQAIELRKNDAVAQVTAPHPEINPFALQPGCLGDTYDLARCLYNSKLYPNMPNIESVMACIIDANERGVPAATALRNAYVVKGRLGWSAAYIAGLVLRSPQCEYFELVPEKCNEHSATVRFKKRGRPAGEHTYTYDDAQKEGLTRPPQEGKESSRWLRDKKGMLRVAALRTAARAYFPEVTSGVYMPDELRGRQTEEDDDAANV